MKKSLIVILLGVLSLGAYRAIVSVVSKDSGNPMQYLHMFALYYFLIWIGIILGKGSSLPLWLFDKWQVVTVKSVCVSEDGESFLLVVRSDPGKDALIVVNRRDYWVESDRGNSRLKVGYHYRYCGNALVPLPIGGK